MGVGAGLWWCKYCRVRTSPAAMTIASTSAKVGIFLRQSSCLDSVDGVGVGVLGGDSAAALALTDVRALMVGEEVRVCARQTRCRREIREGQDRTGQDLDLPGSQADIHWTISAAAHTHLLQRDRQD